MRLRFIIFLSALVFLQCSPIRSEDDADFSELRSRMVKTQIVARGVKDPRVLDAMRQVPRHRFVPEGSRAFAYQDYPLPIGAGQTISQPYIVAFMTESLALTPQDRVLEIGTGSGYQAAILAEIVKDVYTMEIIEQLGKKAEETLQELHYRNIHIRIGDGYKGWPEEAPFDAVIVTCSPENIPRPLQDQLKEGGRLIIPVGRPGGIQHLVRGVKKNGRLETERVMAVRFVPMVEGD
jgi:protein-L-isoaspartate(D-aspartate) O-methyltransferase